MPGFEEIVLASKKLHTCNIVYEKNDGSIVSHEIFGYSLREGDLMGFRVDVGEIRRFKIDRIIDAVDSGNTFVPEYPVEL